MVADSVRDFNAYRVAQQLIAARNMSRCRTCTTRNATLIFTAGNTDILERISGTVVWMSPSISNDFPALYQEYHLLLFTLDKYPCLHIEKERWQVPLSLLLDC